MPGLRHFASALLLWSAAAAAEERSLRSQLDGRWKLMSTEQLLADGTKRPNPLYQPGAVAYLLYASSGGMCAIFPTADDKALNAYCGKFELNEGERYVVHNIEIKNIPVKADQARVDEIGAVGNRYVTIDGNRLKLRIADPRPGVEEDTQTWKRDD